MKQHFNEMRDWPGDVNIKPLNRKEELRILREEMKGGFKCNHLYELKEETRTEFTSVLRHRCKRCGAWKW